MLVLLRNFFLTTFDEKQDDLTEIMLTRLPKLNTWAVCWMFMEGLRLLVFCLWKYSLKVSLGAAGWVESLTFSFSTSGLPTEHCIPWKLLCIDSLYLAALRTSYSTMITKDNVDSSLLQKQISSDWEHSGYLRDRCCSLTPASLCWLLSSCALPSSKPCPFMQKCKWKDQNL